MDTTNINSVFHLGINCSADGKSNLKSPDLGRLIPTVCPTPDLGMVSLDSEAFRLDDRCASAMIASSNVSNLGMEVFGFPDCSSGEIRRQADSNRMLGKTDSLKRDFTLTDYVVLEKLKASILSTVDVIINSEIEERLLTKELPPPLDGDIRIEIATAPMVLPLRTTPTHTPVVADSSRSKRKATSAIPAMAGPSTTFDSAPAAPLAVAGPSRPALYADLPAEGQCSIVLKRGKKKPTITLRAAMGANLVAKRKYPRWAPRQLDEGFAEVTIVKRWCSARRSIDASVNELADHMQDSLRCDTATPRPSRPPPLENLWSSEIEDLRVARVRAKRVNARYRRRKVVDPIRKADLQSVCLETRRAFQLVMDRVTAEMAHID